QIDNMNNLIILYHNHSITIVVCVKTENKSHSGQLGGRTEWLWHHRFDKRRYYFIIHRRQ
ncbi:MAG: hypothetical protein AAGU32_22920, partial [Bacillota bacterium]